MLRVIDVDYIRNYELLVTFNDGNKKLVNLEPYLTGEVSGSCWIRKNLFNMV